MSERWPGGIVRATPVTPTGPLQNGTAPGMWTLDQANYWTKQGLWPIAGNVLAVEDVFSTYLYTGNGSTQTITNGIDLSGQGGLVWLKNRSNSQSHGLFDTSRGENPYLCTDLADSQFNFSNGVVYNSNGFTNKSNSFFGGSGAGNGNTYTSWTFREAPKFFDVVTYTGDGVAGRTISHNLGVAPGCIIVKQTSGTENWRVYHRSTGNGQSLYLNTTDAALATSVWNSTSPTSTDFTVSGSPAVNGSGSTYVAYLYAHDATSDGIIQCGSYSGSGSAGNTVTLGWEPQWVMLKASTTTQGWWMYDNMRGMPVGSNDAALSANTTSAEQSYEAIQPTATGFQLMNGNADTNAGGQTYIYIAIRRGPMKTPTLGTTVFNMATRVGTGTNTVLTGAGFPVDLVVAKSRFADWEDDWNWGDRLRGISSNLSSNKTAAQAGNTGLWFNSFASMTGYTVGSGASINRSTSNFIDYYFRRAPSFFDEVCYTGTGSATTLNHNLGVVPELTIFKSRSGAAAWYVLYDANSSNAKYATLNTTDAGATATYGSGNAWSGQPTATTLSLGSFGDINGSGSTYVAWLFASCPGVSKVGSYTGNGSSQTINCGFTTGARFFLVKRTDSTGDWWVWDSARGITAPADPALRLNSTAAEVTSADATDPDNSGIIVNQEGTCNINVNGATYIFLAIS